MFESLIWIVPAAVAGFGLWRPRAGLLVLAATLPFFGAPPGGPYLAALDVAAIAAIVTAWRGGRAGPSPLTWPVAAFVAVSLASLVPSPYQPPSWQPSILFGLLRALPGVETWSAFYTWRAAADLILGLGLFLAVRRAFAGCSPLALAWAFLGGLTATLVLGVLFAGGVVDLAGFRPQVGIERLSSVFFLSGWFSQYIVLATPPAIAVLLTAGGWGRRLAFPLTALALACLALTLQRGAWVAVLAQILLVAIVVALRWRSQRGKISRVLLQISGALFLAAVTLVATGSPIRPVLERARSIESGLTPRLAIWTTTAEMARERPLLGWGLGSFAPAYDLVHPRGSQEASPWRNTAHSLYLDVAAERGLLGLLALGLVGWSVALCLVRPRSGQEDMALALGAVLAGSAVYGLVQYLFHLKSIAWLLWLLLGTIALVTRRDDPLRSTRVAQILFAVAVLLVPIRAAMEEPPRYQGNHTFGLHEIEGDSSGNPFRWTERSAAVRIPWQGETLVLDLANGHPQASEWPLNVVIGLDGETCASVEISGGWEEHSIELGSRGEIADPSLKDSLLGSAFGATASRKLSGSTLTGHETVQARDSISVETTTVGSGAELSLKAGNAVAFGDGFSVESGGTLSVVVDGGACAFVQPREGQVVLTIHASRTFRPFSDLRGNPNNGASLDIRSLGVAIREPRWE